MQRLHFTFRTELNKNTLLDGSKHQGQGETTAAHPYHAVTYWDTVGMGRGARGR